MKKKSSPINILIKKISSHEYLATIIISIKPINFNHFEENYSQKENLIKVLLSLENVLKIKEEKMILFLAPYYWLKLDLKRNFNLLINNKLISEIHTFQNDQNRDLEQFLNNLTKQIEVIKLSGRITHIVFEYKINFLFEEN